MTLNQILKEQIDPEELKFKVNQLLKHVSVMEKQKKDMENENRKIKSERDRLLLSRRQNPINTTIKLKNPAIRRSTSGASSQPNKVVSN